MAKLKNCKSCNKEVSKSAKVCPHCGHKLKMGFFAKFGIFVIILIALGVALSPSPEDIQKKLAEVENATPTTTSSSGALATMFSFISDSTDVQRENKEKELLGQIVEWSLPVFDVKVQSAENNVYRIQTSGDANNVGAFVDLHARNDAEAAEIEALGENDMVHFKGEISGVFMRNIQIDNARLVK